MTGYAACVLHEMRLSVRQGLAITMPLAEASRSGRIQEYNFIVSMSYNGHEI